VWRKAHIGNCSGFAVNKKEIWLVVVTAGRWQRHGIKEARAAGLKVLAIDADPNAEGFTDADHVLNIELNNIEAVIEILHSLGKNIRGAVSFSSEAGMNLAAEIREEFNLPGPRTMLCQRLLDKAIQRSIWSEKGVPGPKWEVFRDPNAALKAISTFGFPLIIKPTDSSGSRGVTKIESAEDDISDAIARAFQFARSGQIILEWYMVGTEFTVEIFAANGVTHVLAVSEKKKVEGTRGTVANELATPNRPKAVVALIADAVVAAFRALGYTEGPGHAEVILGNDGNVGLVEVAGRGGGFMVFDGFVPAVSGMNIARLTALQAVGLPVGEISNIGKSAVLRFFPSFPGVLLEISGFEEANQIEGVEAAPFVKEGDHFHRAMADGDRLGYILSCAETPIRAKELADKAEKMINLRFKDIK
jgi:biotin carboxylase